MDAESKQEFMKLYNLLKDMDFDRQCQKVKLYAEVKYNPGRYYVGDPCYVLERYEIALRANYDFNFVSYVSVIEHNIIWEARTAFGDGFFEDQFGRGFSVDSGGLAVIPEALLDEKTLIKYSFNIFYFDKCFVPERTKDGIFLIGDIIINTGEYDP